MGRFDHTHVIVGNLKYDVTEEQLRAELDRFGEIEHFEIPRRLDGVSKGLGIVDFKLPEDADKVHAALDHKILFGRLCYVRFGDTPEEPREPRERRSPPRSERDRYERDRYDRGYDSYDRPRGPPRSPPRRRRSPDYSSEDGSPGRAPRYDRGRERGRDRDRDREEPRYRRDSPPRRTYRREPGSSDDDRR